MDAELPDGFVVPIHRSLTEPVLVMGLPRRVAILLWTVGLAVVFGLHQFWFIPLQVGLHCLFAALTKRDPLFFEVFRRAVRSQRRLEP